MCVAHMSEGSGVRRDKDDDDDSDSCPCGCVVGASAARLVCGGGCFGRNDQERRNSVQACLSQDVLSTKDIL